MPGIKDGPRNLKQMGAGRGAGASSGGGGRTTPRSGKIGKEAAKIKKQYAQNVKYIVKAGRKTDASIMRALNKRGGTKPYSKMEYEVMSRAKTKPSSGRMSSGYKKGPGRG